jgi:acyl carrier protein
MDEADSARLQQVLADVFSVPLDGITPQSSPETISGWDSIHHMSMVIAVEQEFDVRFAPEEIEQLFTIQAICDALSTKLQQTPRQQ